MNVWSLESYCKTNTSDTRCICIVPPISVLNISRLTGQPYYCWFKPCFDEDNYKTLAIQQAQLNCQVTNCVIDVSDISISGGTINITNMCGSLASRLTSSQIGTDLSPYEWSFRLPILDNLVSLSAVAILLGVFVFSFNTKNITI